MSSGTQSQHKIVLMAIIASALGFFSCDIYLPAAPMIAHALQTTTAHMQATVSFFMIPLAISSLILAPISDKIGRRPMLLLFFTASISGSLLLLTSHISLFFTGRILQGIGATSGLTLSRSILRDVTTDKKHLASVYAIYSTVVNLAPAISPLFGAYIAHHISWQAIFILLAALYGIQMIWTLFQFKETSPLPDKTLKTSSSLMQNTQVLLRSRIFLGTSLMSSLCFGGYIAYLTAIPFILQKQLHLSTVLTGWLMASLAIGAIASRLLNIILLKRFSIDTIIRIGLSILTVACLGYTLLLYGRGLETWSVVLPAILYTFATGLLFAGFSTTAMAPFPNMAGIAAGIYSFIQMTGAGVLSIVVSAHHGNDDRLMAWLFTGIIICVLGLNIWRRRS